MAPKHIHTHMYVYLFICVSAPSIQSFKPSNYPENTTKIWQDSCGN